VADGTRLRVNNFLVKTDWSLSSSLEREVTSQKIHASSPSASEIHTRAPDSIVCRFSGVVLVVALVVVGCIARVSIGVSVDVSSSVQRSMSNVS